VSVTLAATGSSGSPNTLPISDGSSSNGRNRLVIFGDGGDLGGTVYVQLTPNDAEKIVYVRNSLSGSRSILLFQGTYNASNDYEVPAGTTAVVFFNGAGTGAVAANVFNNAFFDGITFADNSKAIFGAGSDLQIYHDGSNSYIDDAGAGTLRIRGYNQVRITDLNDNVAAIFKGNAETTLYHNNASKLATTSGGVDITGTLTSDGLTVDNVSVDGNTVSSTTGSLALEAAGTLTLDTNSVERFRIASNGDISFYEDTGTTPKFFWDASAEKLKIGSIQGGADGVLALKTNASNHAIAIEEASGSEAYTLGVESDGSLGFYNSGSTTASVTFADSGNVGIGTSSPVYPLVVQAANPRLQLLATGTNTGISGLLFGDADTATRGQINYNHSSNSLDIVVNGAERMRIDSTGVNITGNANFADNDKAIFGAGSDLQIYHDGSDSYVSDQGTGDLILRGGSNVKIQNANGGQTMINALVNSAVSLSYNGSTKLATTSTGADITGELSLDTRMTVDGGTGYGSIELGGDSGAFIDFKEPLSEDFNGRIVYTDGNGFIFGGNVGIPVKLAYGGTGLANVKLATTSGGVDITGNLTSSRVTIDNGLADGGELLLASQGYNSWQLDNSAGSVRFIYDGKVPYQINGVGDAFIWRSSTSTSTEYMRIQSGNLLLGKSSSDIGDTGLEADSNGHTKITRSSGTANVNTVLQLNRLTTDGDILTLRKNSTEVGSIGTQGGDIQLGTGAVGLRFKDAINAIQPQDLTTGTGRDAAIDLGVNVARFKDLYLSGVARVEEARIGPSSLQTATITGLKANANKCITGDPEGGEFVAYRVDNAIAFGDFIGAYLFGNDDNTATEDHFCGMWAKGAATSGTMDMFFAAGNTGYETDTAQMTLKASGFLGVGTETPASNLHVQARTSTENCGLRVISGTSNVSYINLGDTDDHNICSIEHDNSTNQLKIYTNNSVAMAIDVSKLVSINTTSAAGAGYTHRLYVNDTRTGTSSATMGLKFNSTATRRQINFFNPNGIVGRIQTSGTATAYVTSSDYRLKENVVDITDGIERVKQLSPKRFNFIADADLTVDGFIAHETQTVVPEAIDGVKDETHAVGDVIDAAGEIVETGIAEPEDLQEGHTWTATGSEPVYQGIDQSKIVPVLTAALKEAIAKIEALETRLTALEG
jgi:hypothetical protein